MNGRLSNSIERIATRLTWPGPTPFDRLRGELFALLTALAVVGLVAHSFYSEFCAE